MEFDGMLRPQHSTADQVRAFLMLGALFLSLIVVALLLGGMVRHEISPWLWAQWSYEVARHGTTDGIFTVAVYLIFYASSIFLPYCVLRFLFWLSFLNSQEGSADVVDMASIRMGLLAIALAVGIGVVVFLESVVAFLRAVPTGMFGEWAILAAGVASVILLLGGIGVLRSEVKKLSLSIPYDTYILHRCANCDHMWVTESRRLGNSQLKKQPFDAPNTAGGYPIR